jgi:hypothetical protein
MALATRKKNHGVMAEDYSMRSFGRKGPAKIAHRFVAACDAAHARMELVGARGTRL